MPLQELRLRVFDIEQWIFPRHPLGEASPVRIVQIDDESIEKFGQWPWPRTLIARLVDRIAAAQPQVLGIDILFPAPDRTSPPAIAKALPELPPTVSEALAQLPSNESRLAAAMAKVPTVLGLELTDKEKTPTRSGEGDALAALPRYSGVVQSMSAVADAAQAYGSISVEPDVDGVFRRLSLVARYGDTLVPGFAAAVLAVSKGTATLPRVRARPGGIEVAVGPTYLPADATGAAWIYFARETPFFSASDVLDGAVDPAQLKQKIVLLAVTNAGTDLKRTPLGLMYGIEFHAQWIDSLFAGALLARPGAAFWIELSALLIGALLIVGLVRYDRPVVAASAAAGIVVVFLAGELTLFRFAGWLIDGVYPAAATVAAFGAMLQGSLAAAQRARRRLEAELQRERERQARLDGELAAARTIQMGLLPHRFPAFPERRDIEVYARIEPARSVGGDLYEYLLIDANRLFFMIADVSGKGIPAALFMAMTKQVVHDAAIRPGAALDRVLAEANNKIAVASADLAEEGGDMMFVTAFAGILDLVSGEVVYASAGHDAPFVLRDSRELRQLATEGGPPLGAVEDFGFPLDRDHLEPGEVLLLYTDGVTEAQDRTGALYSAGRLSGLLASAPAVTAESVVGFAFEDVRRFTGEAEQADDITLLAIRRIASG